MKKLFWILLILCNAAFAGGSNPGLYYGQVPTAAQWNSYFSAKLDYTPGPVSTIPYWDGSGNQVNALISGDCTSSYNIFSCKATSLDGGTLGAIPYQTGASSTAFLSGNITTTPEFLTSTGTGATAQAPIFTSSTGTGLVVLNTSPTISGPIITGGSINNTPIGQSTAAAGTFTSLASAGSSFSASAPAGSLVQDGTGVLTITPAFKTTGVVNGGIFSQFSNSSTGVSASIGLQLTASGGSSYIFQNSAANSPANELSFQNNVAGGGISFLLQGSTVARFAPTTGRFLINTTTDNGTDALQVNGSTTAVGVKTTAGFTGSTITAEVTAATYTQSVNDDYIPVNFAGTVTITMLNPATYPGKYVKIRTYQAQAVNSASANISINGVVGSSILAATAGKWAELKSDGVNWEMVDNN